MTFTLWLEDIYTAPAQSVLEQIQHANKAPLGELGLFDLIRDGERPLVWGIYFFFSQDGHLLYVGKNSARSFAERIPVHHCLHPDAWMNHLVKRTMKKEKLDCLAAAAEAARNYTLLLIAVNCKEHAKHLRVLEKFFRIFAVPKYNLLKRRKRHERLDLSALLSVVLMQISPRAKKLKQL